MSNVKKRFQLSIDSRVHAYHQAGCGFLSEWSFIVAFKKREIEANWFANEALLNLKISKRILPTLSDESPLSILTERRCNVIDFLPSLLR